MKPFTGILKNKLEEHIKTREEQQGFRRNRSTTDAIFTALAYMCFIDMTKAFDRHSNTRRNQTGSGLSPSLFNILMDTTRKAMTSMNQGYRINTKRISTICYANDAAIIAENEDDLQRQLFRFHQISHRLKMTISINKAKGMKIAREPVRCKLAIEDKIIEQVLQFRYLGVDLSSSHDPVKDPRSKINKAAGWANQYMRTKSNVKIYKTCVRPIMTYGIEIREATHKTK
ncbi:uncharacterized protein LOC125504114 [Dendroctonus ponderosae]|uniref:uncharacterized protein LOC125504114 n=1 Tax=Dendroctonus ponderosae TaxID=77166 RepID=UPI002035EE74|nr:uncharacterized protein LOC125504114 [Dendroctonus ponderosae]